MNKDYVKETLKGFLEDGTMTKRDFAILSKDGRFEVKSEKSPIYVVLEPTIADRLSPYSLALYYWLKSLNGYEQIDLSIKQMSRMTSIKSQKKIRACLFALYYAGAIKISKTYKDVHIITLCDGETGRRLDSDMNYRDTRGKHWSNNAPDKIDDIVPRSTNEQIRRICKKEEI